MATSSAAGARCGARASCSSRLGASSFTGSVLRAAAPRRAAPCGAATFFVEAAATKAKKAETIETLKGFLDPSTTIFVAGVNFKGFTVRSRRRRAGARSVLRACVFRARAAGAVAPRCRRATARRRLQATPAGARRTRAHGGAARCRIAASSCRSRGMHWLFGQGYACACRSRLTGVRRPASPLPLASRAPQVKDFEIFRSKLPKGTELFVAKNTLVKKVIAGTTYEPLGAACVGPNAFLFSGEDVASRHARRRSCRPQLAPAHARTGSARAFALFAPQTLLRTRATALHARARARGCSRARPLSARRVCAFVMHSSTASVC
jgi:hypothetical protein